MARKYGIPTTLLETVEADCAESIKNGEELQFYSGHSFCECFADGKWVLTDPIKRVTEKEYNPEDIRLTGNHTVGGKQNFIAYGRRLDIGHKQTQIEYVEAMKNAVLNDDKEVIVEPVTKEELINAGFSYEKPEIEINNENDKKLDKEEDLQNE